MAATLELPKAAPFLIQQNYEAYTEEQHAMWAELVRRRMPQIKKHAAREYLEGFEYLGLPCDRLPNLVALSAKLQPRTGWNTTPVSGFMPGPAFFEMLAARRFPTTIWLRSRDSLEYTPEPDIFHDVFGHVPMHAHPVFADFLAHYGQVCSLINDEAILERIGRVFWYTVEFGLIRQEGQVKVYGSGLISSNGECSNVIHKGCEVRPFVLDEVLRTPVKVDEMHHLLFAIESFNEIFEAMHTLESRMHNGSRLDD
ncbi:MAG TPA: phenylalanine 4-monooxygenase [Terracidiphilus sp.]|jgi:phenylalanine-4-hydroxylase|nr:phenylalanine 4-monooxygenase [Terracidiphilus sp.]